MRKNIKMHRSRLKEMCGMQSEGAFSYERRSNRRGKSINAYNRVLKCMRSPTSAYHLMGRLDDSVEKIRSNNALGQLFGMERLLYSQQAVSPCRLSSRSRFPVRNGCAWKSKENIVTKKEKEILKL